MQTDIVQPAHRLGKLPPVPAGRAKKRASEMLATSELVPSCLEIARLAAETPTAVPAETGDLLNIRTKGRVELMSKLARPNGDDYPEAASKHLRDAAALLAAARPDGAAYLSGYVVECSLKSIYQLQMGNALGNSRICAVELRAARDLGRHYRQPARGHDQEYAPLLSTTIAGKAWLQRFNVPDDELNIYCGELHKTPKLPPSS